MQLKSLHSFIKQSSTSSNPLIKRAANELLAQVQDAQNAEAIAQPTLHRQESGKPMQNAPKDEIDKNLGKVMQDLEIDETQDKSQFGKAASAFASDIEVSALPKDTQTDILKFVPTATKKHKVVQYGMVVDELLPKVDHHNYESAMAHIKEEGAKTSKKKMGDQFQEKINKKYILILNDHIVDGHHFLALADSLGITCSLKVLDLTPIRFQKVARSLFYELQHHGRQATA